MNNSPIFSHKLQVLPSHIDNQNHVNNVVYLQWVQDISEAHWLHLASDALQQSYFWVALRHEIDYKNQALLDDEILVETKIRSMEGYKSMREVWIYKLPERKLLAQSLTTWCLINAQTRKPCRIGADFDFFTKN